MKRVYNFSAGPAVLPVSVLEEASRGVLEIANSGMSILEVSHRGAEYEAIHKEAQERLLRLLGLSSQDYLVQFLGGGASLQFLMIPMNFLAQGDTAAYSHTGEWSGKAMKEAKRYGNVAVASSSETEGFARIEKKLNIPAGSRYVHITTNNTIEGTQWPSMPDTGGVPLIADASSDFISRPLDYSKFSMIYAGAQKNAGPAGVALVVLKRSFLKTAQEGLPSMLSYKNHEKNDSMFNTPPVFPIYVANLVFKWVEEKGGLKAVEKENTEKANAIYQALDEFPQAFEVVVKDRADRSKMNITFRLKNAEKEKEFLAGAEAKGLYGLKGHRSVGGFRASVYNAFPKEGAQVLADYLATFAKQI